MICPTITKRMHRLLFSKVAFIALILATAFSCRHEVPLSDVPQIGLVSYGPDTVTEFVDSIHFSISYEDGNGDLGENNTDDHNLTVTDSRIGIDYKYRIRQLVPGNAEVPVKGILNFSIPNTFITNSTSQQEVSYAIQIKDRAGNSSNTVSAGNILIIQ
jgi:hypothetical protein